MASQPTNGMNDRQLLEALIDRTGRIEEKIDNLIGMSRRLDQGEKSEDGKITEEILEHIVLLAIKAFDPSELRGKISIIHSMLPILKTFEHRDERNRYVMKIAEMLEIDKFLWDEYQKAAESSKK
jgi:DnaB-helicase binding domain of primase